MLQEHDAGDTAPLNDVFAADLLRGHTDTIVLGVLRRADRYGFEIFKTIRDATGGAYEIKEATLYASYRRLVKDGLVEAYWGDETQGGRRKYYRITDAGRAVYRATCRRGKPPAASSTPSSTWAGARANDAEGPHHDRLRRPGGMTTPSTLAIHRLLDTAFAGVEMTTETQDLKEEMRADLVVRVAELESPASPPRRPRGARSANSVTSHRSSTRSAPSVPTVHSGLLTGCGRAGVRRAYARARDRRRGRPRGDGAGRTPPWGPPAGPGVAVAVLALLAGALVADALGQETTSNYPLPRRRGLAYGVATTLALAGTGVAATYLRDPRLSWLVAGGLGILAATVAFTYLGATQTNRHKAWVIRLQAEHERTGDRFARDPAAAARFGIYTVAIWILSLAAFAGLGFGSAGPGRGLPWSPGWSASWSRWPACCSYRSRPAERPEGAHATEPIISPL